MLNSLLKVVGALLMTVLIFLGVVVAAGVGVLLWMFWTALQFAALGVAAVVAVVFTIVEAFRYRKSEQVRKSSDSKSEADQSPN